MNKDTNEILRVLRSVFPNPASELHFNNAYELLIAVILSAQCTDKRVNEVTKDLFKIYDTPSKLASANISDVEKIIKPCGFYKNKAKNIVNCSKELVERFNGVVPSKMDELTSLSGVGRKTANVVRAVWFKIPSMPVDTHVFRVSNRLGLSNSTNVEDCERELLSAINEDDLIDAHHLILLFGRYYCKAIHPMCENCVLKDHCNYFKEK